MDSKDNMRSRVISFINKYFWFQKIGPELVLNESLKTEDEVFFMFVDFFEHFNVESKGFNILRYFDPEPTLNIFQVMYDRLFGKKVKQINHPPLTIEHLIKVAEHGEWFDPDENGNKE